MGDLSKKKKEPVLDRQAKVKNWNGGLSNTWLIEGWVWQATRFAWEHKDSTGEVG